MVISLLAFGIACFRLAVAQGSSPAPERLGIDVMRDFILTDKDAVGLLAPRVVCPARATQIVWSPDGAYLVVERSDAAAPDDVAAALISGVPTSAPPGPVHRELDVYSTRTRKVQAVIPLLGEDLQNFSVTWLHGDSQFVAVFDEPTTDAAGAPSGYVNVAALVSAHGKIQELARVATGSALEPIVSPRAPIVALMEIDPVGPQLPIEDPPRTRFTHSLRFFRTDGAHVPTVTLPDDFTSFDWGPDGTPYVMTIRRDESGKHFTRGWYRVNFDDGKLTPLDREPKLDSHSPDPGYSVHDITYRVDKGDVRRPPVHGVELRSDTRSDAAVALVSADGSDGALSPTLDAVAYLSQGIAMVRPIVHVPKDQYLDARVRAIRTALMEQAKEVALAILMNAADMDDNLVSNATDWRGAIAPYDTNPSLTDGFVYTNAGGLLTAVQNPATTVLGYIDGPGGRATAYVDGHVQWIPNP